MDKIEIGSNLKHLSETLGMGSCFGWYEKNQNECKECQICVECKTKTKEKGNEKEESINEEFIAKVSSVMAENNFNKEETKTNEKATMCDYSNNEKFIKIIFSKTGRIKIIFEDNTIVLKNPSLEEIIEQVKINVNE